ncbi:hypothetical protein T484DRAFT_1551877, partial [Baffinella frigidus]
AALNGHEGAMGVLLQAGADREATNNSGWTTLHLAALGGGDGCARLLLEAGADRRA